MLKFVPELEAVKRGKAAAHAGAAKRRRVKGGHPLGPAAVAWSRRGGLPGELSVQDSRLGRQAHGDCFRPYRDGGFHFASAV